MVHINKIIVDTHIFIWDVLGSSRLSDRMKSIMDECDDCLYVSSITFWEVGMLVGKNRLSLNVSVDKFCDVGLRKRQYKVLPISPLIANTVSLYANAINKDPADRIIAATTMVHNATLLTEDNNLKGFDFLKTTYP